MVTKQQIADRKRTVASAVASQYLEGIAPDRETLVDLERFIQGGQGITDVMAGMKRN